MVSMFRAAYAFNQNIGSWNAAAVTNMQDMFQLASAFNQNIGSWNTAVVANMRGMFHAASAFNQTLTGWCVSNISSEPSGFSNSSPLSVANKPSWGACSYFISTWELTSSDLTFVLPLKDYTNITINWGDGSSPTTHTGGAMQSHTYASAGTYTITVAVNDAAKDIGEMYLGGHASRTLIRTVENWGEGTWETFYVAFKGATSLTIPATDEPDLSLVTNMREAFANCTSLVGTTLNDWNTAAVTTTQAMFYGASVFNGNISSWNTSAVTTLYNMFYAASSFNQDINTSGSSWNTDAVTNMSQMFFNAGAFNVSL